MITYAPAISVRIERIKNGFVVSFRSDTLFDSLTGKMDESPENPEFNDFFCATLEGALERTKTFLL